MLTAHTRYCYTFPMLLDAASDSTRFDLLLTARRYADSHFPTCQTLKQKARALYQDMTGGFSADILAEVEDRYTQFSVYLDDLCCFFLYSGAELALRQYLGMSVGAPDPLVLKSEFSQFLVTDHLTEQRRLSWLGILKAGEAINCPRKDRSYQLQYARARLSCCYICVILGYEYAVAHFVKFSEAYQLDCLLLAELRRRYLRLSALEELVSQDDLKLLILDI